MTLQEMYNYVKANPGTTAYIPQTVSRAHIGVPYTKARRLVQLGYLRREADGYKTRYYVTDKNVEYRHSGCLIIKPRKCYND